MRRNGIENGLEGTDLKRIMARNGDVVLAIGLCRQPHVRSGLASLRVAKSAQGLGEVLAADIAWQLHRASTSSRT